MSSRTAAPNKSRLCIYTGLTIVFCLLTSAHLNSQAVASNGPTPASACHLAEPTVDGATDVEGIKTYKRFVANLLSQERFDDLDCIAHQTRIHKTRLPGGTWKLVVFYSAVGEPEGHATQQDWIDHFAPLEHWVSANPNSITARVALANSYVSYAWDARGKGYSDTVTANGQSLFDERLAKAKDILDKSLALPEKCPHWYVVMQNIAQGQGWDLSQDVALFQKAVASDPDYYSYYRVQAILLLPKWYGQEGDAAAFAAQAADHIGGNKGDILYFEIAAKLACACNEPELNRMSWDRIQKGFAGTEEAYGRSVDNLNAFALMAINFNDYVVADAAFKGIGEQWDEDTWRTRKYFDGNREYAANIGPMQARSRKMIQEAITNQQSAEGAAYKKQVESKFIAFVQQCALEKDVDLKKFDYMLLIGKDGIPQNGWSPQPTSMMVCLGKRFMTAQIKKEPLFPPPPRDTYWLKFEVDPFVYKSLSN